MLVFALRKGKIGTPGNPQGTGKNATHTFWRLARDRRDARAGAMTLGDRLKLVRGTTSQKAFAAEVGIHENSVSNAERRNSATQEYLLRIAHARNINLHWLLTGHGAMRLDERDTSLLAEKLNVALVDALRLAYGARYASVPLETRARALRAGATYLRAIGVTEETLPDGDALARLLRLTIDVMRGAA
jgi:hypothetical protein